MQLDTAPTPEFTSSDAEHLKVLAILHFVFAGFVVLGGCFMSIYLVAGLAMATGKLGDGGDGPPPEFGWFMVGFGGCMLLFFWTTALLVALAGRKLLQRRSHLYCTIVAALLCLNIPIGTVLGVFTLIVLMRPGVLQEFRKS